jgi:hypothetical protein
MPIRLSPHRLSHTDRSATQRVTRPLLLLLLTASWLPQASAQRAAPPLRRARSLPPAQQPAPPWPALSPRRSAAPLLPPGHSFKGPRPRIMLTGYWPPTNEMLRRFSPNAEQNPSGWIGSDWEGRGYDIFAYFPEFDPPDCNSCGKGEGDLEVDYQDTSLDGHAIADTLQPVAIITFSRGAIDWSWEVEMNQFNRSEWINDYLAPRQPTPTPPDPTVPAEALRLSGLPVQAIIDSIAASGLPLDPWVDWSGDGGGFLSEFAAYHGVWYQAALASPSSPRWCLAGGHVHVGGQVDWESARLAAESTLRALIAYIDPLLHVEQCQRDVGYQGPGTGTVSVCGDTLRSGAEVELWLRGAPAEMVAWVVMGDRLEPQPYHGGQLAPYPPRVIYTAITDVQGQLHLPGLPLAPEPVTRYLQVVYVDPEQPQERGFSNAVELRFLGSRAAPALHSAGDRTSDGR